MTDTLLTEGALIAEVTKLCADTRWAFAEGGSECVGDLRRAMKDPGCSE